MSRMTLAAAIKVLAAHMGGSKEEQKKGVDVVEFAKELRTNELLSAKQFKAVQEMDDEQRSMLKVLLDAMDAKASKSNEEEEVPPGGGEEEEEMIDEAAKAAAAAAAQPQANKRGGKAQQSANADVLAALTKLTDTVTSLAGEVQSLKANSAKQIEEVIQRRDLLDRLTANEEQILGRAELEALPTDVLVKLEKAQRPADYSGQGRFASNMDDGSNKVQPLRVNTALLTKPKAKQ